MTLDAFLQELVALYERVDALYADWSCPGTTECCRFGITGRQPYVTGIELRLVRHALARRGGPLAARRRALPLHREGPDERTCPLLDRSGRCAVYAERPLGCRTFFCDRAQRGAGPSREELRELVRELQDLAARHQMGGELARPLTHALEAG
jgi:Fe-S-cluster containining protein